MKVDADLNEEEYIIDSDMLCDHDQLAQQLLKGPKKKLELGATNMMPIISAFKRKRQPDMAP